MAEPKDPKDPKEEDKQSLTSNEDKVAQAYENISRKLESLRSGKTPEDDEPNESEESNESQDVDVELEEWKGPKGVKTEEKEGEGEMELRRVKLKNLEEPEESEEPNEPNESKGEDKPKKKWEPVEDDPLDEDPSDAKALDGKHKDEESEESEESDEPKESKEPKKSEESGTSDSNEKSDSPGRSMYSENESKMDLPKRKDPQPDTLDDLTEDIATQSDEEDDYDIPNLKGSRQRAGDMEYNTPLQTETFAGSYRDKSSMENNDPNNFFSQHNQSKLPKRANKFHLLVLVVIGIAVIGFTVYILKGGFGAISINPEPSPSPSEQTSSTPTPTPTPEPERSKYKVRVLNGSGKTGLAKTVSDKLKELGYQIDKTGNATNSAFQQTVIRVKPEAESFIPRIVTDLTPEFDAAGNTSLKDADTVDIEIILGAK